MPASEKQNNDFKWYLNNFNDLYKQYGDDYIAIKDNKVFENYKTFSECYSNAIKKEKLGTFIIQKCGKDKSAYTLTIATSFI